MKIEVNPSYEHLRSFIEQIPERFESEGKVIYAGRNLVKIFDADGLKVNVKRYKVPILINRIAYTFFREPKGKRAFEYPKRLLDKGFETPEPIAYIEERSAGLISYSYFLSVQSAYPRNFYEFGDAEVSACEDVVKAFARYTAALHEAGVLHRDYSPGNILFDCIDGEYHFMLVDINRMFFGEVDIRKGCANFARLWGKKAFFELLAKEYALARRANVDDCIRRVLECRKRFWISYAKRHEVKYRLEL